MPNILDWTEGFPATGGEMSEPTNPALTILEYIYDERISLGARCKATWTHDKSIGTFNHYNLLLVRLVDVNKKRVVTKNGEDKYWEAVDTMLYYADDETSSQTSHEFEIPLILPQGYYKIYVQAVYFQSPPNRTDFVKSSEVYISYTAPAVPTGLSLSAHSFDIGIRGIKSFMNVFNDMYISLVRCNLQHLILVFFL